MATIVEIRPEPQQESSLRQRWSHYFVLLFSVASLFVAYNVRESILNATVTYSDVETGIRLRYPANWLADSGGSSVLSVQDVRRVGFKTTMQISIQPVSLNTASRNLLDALSLDRAQTLTAYRILTIADDQFIRGDIPATSMRYIYVDVANDPVLQTIPTVVEGVDVITIREGQAIIITLLADANIFDEYEDTFQRFLNAVEF